MFNEKGMPMKYIKKVLDSQTVRLEPLEISHKEGIMAGVKEHLTFKLGQYKAY